MEKTVRLKKIYFPAIRTAVLEECGEQDLNQLPDNVVAIRTHISTVSCGTELANILGKRIPSEKVGGADSFPRQCGYTGAGEVVAVGKGVTKVAPGDRVIYFWGKHQNYNLVTEDRVVRILEGVSDSEAALAFIASFSMAAIRKVKPETGESSMVMGLGLLGQLATALLHAAGTVPVIAADPIPERREEALRNGADFALDPLTPDFAETVKRLTDGGVKAATEVTGVGAGLNETLDCMAKFGRIALLGCTRDSNFTVDWYEKIHQPGITLVGAHTNARPKTESSAGYFTHEEDMKCIMKLCRYGRLDLKRIVKETHSPQDAPEVYRRLMEERNFPIGVQFDWHRLDG